MTSQPARPGSLHTDSWGCGPGIPAFPSLSLAPKQCRASGSAHRPRASASHARATAAALSTRMGPEPLARHSVCAHPEMRPAQGPRGSETGPGLESEFCIIIKFDCICSFRNSGIFHLGSILESRFLARLTYVQ